MSTSIERPAPVAPAVLTDEYEDRPVPLSARRSLLSVASVWAGFPMIITGAVTGATLVNGLGFTGGLLAMVLGNLLLFGYVGALSAVSARTGRNFALQARQTFGRVGHVVVSGLLSTLVVGWFAVQTGLVGASMNTAFGVNAVLLAVVAGILFTAFTLLGIRALSIIGLVSVPLFLVLAIVAVAQVSSAETDVWGYTGDGVTPIALGVGVSLVFALFADSGTMTADFTRWARTPRQAVLATASAFPAANLIAMVAGGVIAAAGGSGDVFGIIAEHGGVLAVIAVVFLFVNLGSVCTHCLYNGAMGWSSILGGRMRVLTVVLGVIGVVAAALGIWSVFIDWLNLLGVIVPPIGAVLIVDQVVLRRADDDATPAVRWQPFAAWAIGSGAALVVHLAAPGWSTVVVGLLVAGAAHLVLSLATRSTAGTAGAR